MYFFVQHLVKPEKGYRAKDYSGSGVEAEKRQTTGVGNLK